MAFESIRVGEGGCREERNRRVLRPGPGRSLGREKTAGDDGDGDILKFPAILCRNKLRMSPMLTLGWFLRIFWPS